MFDAYKYEHSDIIEKMEHMLASDVSDASKLGMLASAFKELYIDFQELKAKMERSVYEYYVPITKDAIEKAGMEAVINQSTAEADKWKTKHDELNDKFKEYKEAISNLGKLGVGS